MARLEAEKAELSAELSTVQGRLHDALVRGQCQSAAALPSAAPHTQQAATFRARSTPPLLPSTHPPQEVLEGVLAERSTLLKQTHDLRGQLATVLAQQHGCPADAGCGSGAAVETTEVDQTGATPARVLRQELLLAQASGAAVGGAGEAATKCQAFQCNL